MLGSLLGSFLNVCIYRLPRNESIVSPGSHCPECKAGVPFWANVPILGYLILRGKCNECRHSIPMKYPLVELLTAVLLALAWHDFGLSLPFFRYSLFMLFLLVISFIDLDTKLILNVLTYPGIVLGLGLSFFSHEVSFWQALIGLVIGGGFLWLIGIVGEYMFKQESMGGGDIKLGAMIGVFIGPKVIVALFLAFFLAMPVIAIGLGTKKLQLGSKLPFGPFLSLSALIIVFWGGVMFDKYLEIMNIAGS